MRIMHLFFLACLVPPSSLLSATEAPSRNVQPGAPTTEERVDAPRVEIYTTPSCAYCKMLRKYLRARGIDYVEHNINATSETRAAFYASGAHGVPVVVIGERRIQGFNPLRIEAALRELDAAQAEG